MTKLDFITDDIKDKQDKEPQWFEIRNNILYCGGAMVEGVRNLRITQTASNPGIIEVEIEAIIIPEKNRVKLKK